MWPFHFCPEQNLLNDNDSLPRGQFYRLKYRLFWGSTTECLSDICFSYPSFWCDFLPFSFSRSATFSHNRHRLTLFGWIQIGKCWNCQMESCSIPLFLPSPKLRRDAVFSFRSIWLFSDDGILYEICTKYVRKTVQMLSRYGIERTDKIRPCWRIHF